MSKKKTKTKSEETTPLSEFDRFSLSSLTLEKDDNFYKELKNKPYRILIEDLSYYAEYSGYMYAQRQLKKDNKSCEMYSEARKRVYAIEDQIRLIIGGLREDIDCQEYYQNKEIRDQHGQ